MKKRSNSAEKIGREDFLVSFGFVCYVKKGKHERGPFALSFRWLAGLEVFVKSGPFSVRSVVWRKEGTRRERSKSAPYLWLKNIQGTTIGNICKTLSIRAIE